MALCFLKNSAVGTRTENGNWPGMSLKTRFRRRPFVAASSTSRETTEPFSDSTDAAPFVAALDTSRVATLAVTSPDLSPNLAKKAWQNYLTLLEKKPVLVKSCTSFFGFMVGDICAQLIVGTANYDLYRTLRMILFGVLMDGPLGHCWYLFLDKNVFPESPKETKAVLAKTTLDQLFWAPFFSCVFFTFNQTLQGHPELSWQTIQDTLVPTLTANYALWPLAHLINFKFVPSNQRILYINFVQILWTSYLSNLAARGHHLGTKVHKHLAHSVSKPWIHGTHQHLLPALHHHHHHHLDFLHSYVHRLFG